MEVIFPFLSHAFHFIYVGHSLYVTLMECLMILGVADLQLYPFDFMPYMRLMVLFVIMQNNLNLGFYFEEYK